MEWWDADVMLCIISCSNGVFSGAARVYLGLDELAALAESLDGFPKNPSDSRKVRLGAPDPSFAGGCINLSFHCVDSAGHTVVDANIRADRYSPGGPGSGNFTIRFEPAALDRFVSDLRAPRQDLNSAELAAHL